MIKIFVQISFQERNSHIGNDFLILAISCKHFSVSLYKTQPKSEMLIKTVQIVRENWEVAYFYCENEADFFYAKIQ